jgi:magnesium-transporting ATPase (P-type)
MIQKKKIRKETWQLFKQGERTKQEIYEILVDKYKSPKDVADVLKYIPSTQTVSKYGKWNSTVLVLLIFSTIFFLIIGLYALLSIYLLSIYVVALKKIKYYSWLSFYFLLAILSSTAALIFAIIKPEETFTHWIYITVLLSVNICICFLPIWLQKKLCPKPTERKEVYTNSKGEKRVRIVYEFSE